MAMLPMEAWHKNAPLSCLGVMAKTQATHAGQVATRARRHVPGEAWQPDTCQQDTCHGTRRQTRVTARFALHGLA
eukprot:CAMPEP_0172156120 /NCGR_PEP_ID=MMETSP1050-20130122/3010_1 /TAXON_ID=233186 /ORGANISM="Cryptomonas curvata, Strain CCAP979/52" /LENGTH=74 /DNA_ID=CAMNT_0012825105 /DNA_START=1924 /DNA_END=2148 /DNA_ORIENTATION=-